MRLYFDIEADNLLDKITRIWCICAVDIDTGQEWSFGPGAINLGLDFLSGVDLLVGHNVIRYDLPALHKIASWAPYGSTIQDTLVLARLAHSNLRDTDGELVKTGVLPPKLQGRDSLEAWGYRVGLNKAQYEGGFDAWSQEMQDYCLQDCRTGVALYKHLKVETLDPRSVELEHRVATVCFRMEEAGWPFDSAKAQALYTTLVQRKHELETSLVNKFGSWEEVDKVFVPKRDDKKRGYTKGVEVTKYKTVVFNPGSRRHIEKKLTELGWTPYEFTPSGTAKLDEEILEEIAIPEAQVIVEYLLVQKRLGQIGDGEQAWLKKVHQDGKIHASYMTMGTVTGRASHRNPNIAQVPKCGSPYGAECRDLFTVPEGWTLVGADFEGLELRCLGSYMAHFDRGTYADTVVNGDIHTTNQQAAGLPTRANAKTFIYGFLYGAGDEKIGKIVGKGRFVGAALKKKFLRGLPALGKLREVVGQAAAKKGFLKGVDGRRIPVRAKHAALNSLLQSAGAVLCKRWLVDAHDRCLQDGLRWGWDGDFVIVGWIHDELQVAVRQGLEDRVGAILVECAQRAGDDYGFKCRLDSKFIKGNSWKDTH